ncbi:hypothetical protein DBR32_13115 [Taibaiella sp. KBW10]|uniref:hypothetical protein n=1 Tax=Taibaiella sp. KBW10 TaxID=2153357 RepID=UPI000F5B6D11|nr:hypothetical protein [Taibaiella sp. KBW10]RQO30499.1 hypothetical protein DBR32_13115 [Taibaiella sp. KBW10]
MTFNILILLAIIFAYGVFSYMKQKSQARKEQRQERLREKQEAFMQSLRDNVAKHKEEQAASD